MAYGKYLETAAAAAALAMLLACGSDNPAGPSGGGGGGGVVVGSGGSAGTSGATITIGANGQISPTTVSITNGQSVTFVNSSGSSHDMASDPHPAHTSCPSINAVGLLGNGQTKLTNSFSGTGTCTFHDHNDPNNGNLKGTITVR